MSNASDPTNLPRLHRRGFLKVGSALGLAASVGTAVEGQAQGAASDYPMADVAALADIAPGTELSFFYPDENSPAILMRLTGPAEGGIGPDNSIVAFSLLCTHKGCPVQFKADKQMLICPCHWSSFDPAKGGRIIIGQATEALPQIVLRIEQGRVRAMGVNGLIFGRHTNIL